MSVAMMNGGGDDGSLSSGVILAAGCCLNQGGSYFICASNDKYVKNVASNNMSMTFARKMKVRIVASAKTSSGGYTKIKCGDETLISTNNSNSQTGSCDKTLEVSDGTVFSVVYNDSWQQNFKYRVVIV